MNILYNVFNLYLLQSHHSDEFDYKSANQLSYGSLTISVSDDIGSAGGHARAHGTVQLKA